MMEIYNIIALLFNHILTAFFIQKREWGFAYITFSGVLASMASIYLTVQL